LLLQLAISDGNNRVAANALLGLYYLGESSAISELVRMAADESPLFRSSAAWAMGQTGDVRFQDSLRRLLGDADGSARKRALAAIGRLKAANSQKEESASWHVAARWAGTDQKGLRHVMVSVAGEDGREQPVVPPLGFILNENGPYVTSYRVTERPAPEAMSVVFLIPRLPEAAKAFREGIASCLKWKRTSDLWCVLPYLETGDGAPPETNLDQEPPNFTANADAIQKTLDESARRVECVGLWSSLWRAAKVDNSRSRGKRYIFICSTTEEARLAGHGIVSKASNPNLRIQAISTGPNVQLESFCKSVGAAFLRTVVDEVAETVQQAYLSLLARYEVIYQPVAANAPSLKVRVQSAGGTGETVIAGQPGEAAE
jgi:hypothetical protein